MKSAVNLLYNMQYNTTLKIFFEIDVIMKLVRKLIWTRIETMFHSHIAKLDILLFYIFKLLKGKK